MGMIANNSWLDWIMMLNLMKVKFLGGGASPLSPPHMDEATIVVARPFSQTKPG